MNELRSIVTAQAQEAVTMAEFNATVGNLNQDLQQKLMDLRSESFSKIAELNQQTLQVVSLKANQDDFRQLIDEKVDVSVMKTYLSQKLGLAEFDALKVLVERMNSELVSKASGRDLDSINEFIRNQFDGVAKELLLRVQMKDFCTLLDQKANLSDVNNTLKGVQREVESCIKEQ